MPIAMVLPAVWLREKHLPATEGDLAEYLLAMGRRTQEQGYWEYPGTGIPRGLLPGSGALSSSRWEAAGWSTEGKGARGLAGRLWFERL
jgi:hypothetical protein